MLFPFLVVLAASAGNPVELPATAAVFVAGQDTIAQNAAGRVEVELVRALKKKGVALVDLAALFPPPAAPPSEEGDQLFAAGQQAYDKLDFEAATKALTEAAVFFIKRPAAAKAEQLSEIFLFLGAAELQSGHKAAAQKEITRALQMNPALEPDRKYFGADVQAAFAAAQKEMGARPKGILSVESVPSGADVEAFGLGYGVTPVAEIELPAGRYMVRLTRPGFTPTAAFPDVIAGQSIDVRLTLEAASELLGVRRQAEQLIDPKSFEATALPKAAIELGKATRARFLVLAAVTSDAKLKPTVELQVWNLNTADRLTSVRFDADAHGFEAGAEAVQAWIGRPLPAGLIAKKPVGVEPLFKKWWFWTAVGVVAAGGVTAAVAAAQPRNSGGFNVVLGQP